MIYMEIRKILNISIIIVLLSISVTLFRFGPNDFSNNPPSISFRETAEVFVTDSDIAALSFTFAKLADDASSAKDTVAVVTTEVYEYLQNTFEIQEEDIKTTSFTIAPEYERVFRGQTSKIIGYKVNHKTEIKIRNLDSVSDVLTYITEKNPEFVSGLTFQIDPERRKGFEEEAIAKAIEMAKEKAKRISRESGISLGKIQGIYVNVGAEPRPLFARSEVAFSTAAPNIPISQGTNTVSATANITFELD